MPERMTSKPSVETLSRLSRLRSFSRLLDEAIAIPGTGQRIGIEPILGLIPGGGDLVGLLLSSYILFEGIRIGASPGILARMVLNILVDTTIGSVPILGDLFDVVWKSNHRNVDLLEAYFENPLATRRRNRWAVFLIFLGIIITFALVIAAIAAIVIGVLRLLGL